jgi:hypothetical protein
MEKSSGKGLRITGIVLMGLTAAMNVLGGIGTVCAAFLHEQFPVPAWIKNDGGYQIYMITTIIVGIFCVWSTIQLSKGRRNAFLIAVLILLVGTGISAGHYIFSQSLGYGKPANIKFFTNAGTLIFFLVLLLPPVRKLVDFSSPMGSGDETTTSGLSAMIAGVAMLTIYIWAGPSHTFQGGNWIDVLKVPLFIGGLILTIGGFSAMLWTFLANMREQHLIDDQEGLASR